MPVHLENSIFRGSQTQNLDSAQSHPHLSQRTMASDLSTLVSLREHVNADESGSFCACFESLINWIKGLFTNMVSSGSSQLQAPQESITTSPQTSNVTEMAPLQTTNVAEVVTPLQTGDQIVDKARQYIDFHFNDVNTAGLSNPVNVIVVIRWNGVTVHAPIHQVDHGNVADLKNPIKQMLPSGNSPTWELQDGNPARLEVETLFIYNRGVDRTDPAFPTFDVRRIGQKFDFRTGRSTPLFDLSGVRSDRPNCNIEDIASYIRQAARGNTDQIGRMNHIQNMLFNVVDRLPGQLTDYLPDYLRISLLNQS